MSSLIPLAGPAACAGIMGGMMWWMMRGMRGRSSDSPAQADAESMKAHVAQLVDENAWLRERVDIVDRSPAPAFDDDQR